MIFWYVVVLIGCVVFLISFFTEDTIEREVTKLWMAILLVVAIGEINDALPLWMFLLGAK